MRGLLTICLVACAAFSLGSCSTAQDVETSLTAKPNIIVILADDMRADATGHSGSPIIQTPNIDRLAANGTVFENAFATSAVCTPSRTSLLTGQYERRHGINFNSQSSLSNEAWQQTYPMLMKQAGYFAGYIGKNHTAIGRNEDGVTGYNSGVMDTSFDYWYASHKHLGFYPKDREQHAIFKNAESDTQVEIIEEGVENFMAPNEAFQAGYDFLDSRPKDQPFVLLINFNVPHANGTLSMEQRESDLELYKSIYRDQIEQITLPSSFVSENDIAQPKLPSNVHNGKYLFTYDYAKEADTLTEHKIREMQTISGIDKMIGKLFARLDAQGISEKTIIIFASDHGLMHGEFGLRGKVFLYDPSVKIPLIVYNPQTKDDDQVAANSDLVALIDIGPTVLDLAGLPVPDYMQGDSLKPLMRGEPADWRNELFLENMMTIQNYPRMEGVRTRKWKYIRYFDKANDGKYADMINASINGEAPIYEELFDLENDPGETRNVIDVEANTAIADTLRAENIRLVKTLRGEGQLTTYSNAK
ncbi:MAG: sulfatase-like hydrolase/transferase [Litorimonas sp.]